MVDLPGRGLFTGNTCRRDQLLISSGYQVSGDDPVSGELIWSCTGTTDATCGTIDICQRSLARKASHFWVSGLDTRKIFICDVRSNPSRPKLVKTIHDFVKASGGVVGTHTIYALPGRLLVSGLSNDKDPGGRSALVEYTNAGEYVATHWMPAAEDPRGAAVEPLVDGYG